MSAQGLAFTAPFVVESNTQFRPGPPRGLASATYTEDFNAVKALGRRTGSTRTEAQTELAPFWEGNASVHWNQAANQIARANHLSMSDSNRLLAVLNIAMADTAFTIWSAKRHYGADPAAVTWRPLTAITLADTDGIAETAADPAWLPLVTTPSHPEYPAGHPALNGAAATVLLGHFADVQTFTLTTSGLPSQTYTGISQARADGNNARDLGRDALPQHGCDQRRRRRSDRRLRQRELDAVAPRSALTARQPHAPRTGRWAGLRRPGPALTGWSSTMPRYLVETYVPRSRAREARAAGRDARAAAEELAREGTPVRYVRTTFLPDDETCFHIFEAASEEAVGEACRRAGIGSGRIVPAVE